MDEPEYLHGLACAVRRMMDLQRWIRDGVRSHADIEYLRQAEDRVEQLLDLHFLPPIPSAPAKPTEDKP